jgi:hypothetical protein
MRGTKGGRPPHEPTASNRRRVAVLAGAGWSYERLATLLDIDRNTLTKYYLHELTIGAAEKLAEVMEGVYALAKKGNVTAAKFYSQQAQSPEPTSESLEIVSMPSQAIGVKAQRNEHAKVAQQGTEWQQLLPSSVQ